MISKKIPAGGDLHKTIITGIMQRVKTSHRAHSDRVTKWREQEERFIAYMPEKSVDAMRRMDREQNGTPDYTTIQLPYSYAVVMAAHSYLSSVFLSRSPVFQFSGIQGQGEDAVLAMEALHNWQVYKSRMLANLYIWLQDAPKYGEGWVLNYWDTQTRRVTELIEVEELFLGLIPTGRMKTARKVSLVRGYEGNALANIHPGRVLTDPRYPRNAFQKGEFVVIKTKVSRNDLLRGNAEGRFINTDHQRFKTALANSDTFELDLDHSSAAALEVPKTSAFGTGDDKNASDVYESYEMYIELVPQDWGLGSSNMPEKWVFSCLADYSVLYEARPMGNLHDRFPLAYLEMEMEGYFHHSRSLIEIYQPIQQTLDWLVNTHFFNVRQTLNNQFIFDPSRVYQSDIESKEPGLAIRMKPAAYGTDPRAAIHQLQTANVTNGHLSDMQMMYELGERLGVSDAVMGMSNPSSRRTAQEVRGTQLFGVSRLKTIAEYCSATGWDDLVSMMVQNSQQFFDQEMKLMIAGDAAKLAGEPYVTVDPSKIAGEFFMEPVDGTLPADRFAQANLWRELLTQVKDVPQVLAQYDLGKIFGYVAQLGGIKNLNRFKVEVTPDEVAMQQAQAGNLVPMTPTENPAANLMEPGQIAGMGPTA